MNTKEGEGRNSDNRIACTWCDRTLDVETSVKGSVCVKCYNLMIDAGLKEDEVFRQKQKRSKGA